MFPARFGFLSAPNPSSCTMAQVPTPVVFSWSEGEGLRLRVVGATWRLALSGRDGLSSGYRWMRARSHLSRTQRSASPSCQTRLEGSPILPDHPRIRILPLDAALQHEM